LHFGIQISDISVPSKRRKNAAVFITREINQIIKVFNDYLPLHKRRSVGEHANDKSAYFKSLSRHLHGEKKKVTKHLVCMCCTQRQIRTRYCLNTKNDR